MRTLLKGNGGKGGGGEQQGGGISRGLAIQPGQMSERPGVHLPPPSLGSWSGHLQVGFPQLWLCLLSLQFNCAIIPFLLHQEIN